MPDLALAPVERKAVALFAARLYQSFPGMIQSPRLFGSKARGDARPDSDIDLLVVVKHESCQLWEDAQNLAGNVNLDHDVFLSLKVMGSTPSLFCLFSRKPWSKSVPVPLKRQTLR